MTAYHVWGTLGLDAPVQEQLIQGVHVHSYEGDVACAVNEFMDSMPDDFEVELFEVRRVGDGFLVGAHFYRTTEEGEIEWHRFVEPSGPYEEEEWDE